MAGSVSANGRRFAGMNEKTPPATANALLQVLALDGGQQKQRREEDRGNAHQDEPVQHVRQAQPHGGLQRTHLSRDLLLVGAGLGEGKVELRRTVGAAG